MGENGNLNKNNQTKTNLKNDVNNSYNQFDFESFNRTNKNKVLLTAALIILASGASISSPEIRHNFYNVTKTFLELEVGARFSDTKYPAKQERLTTDNEFINEIAMTAIEELQKEQEEFIQSLENKEDTKSLIDEKPVKIKTSDDTLIPNIDKTEKTTTVKSTNFEQNNKNEKAIEASVGIVESKPEIIGFITIDKSQEKLIEKFRNDYLKDQNITHVIIHHGTGIDENGKFSSYPAPTKLINALKDLGIKVTMDITNFDAKGVLTRDVNSATAKMLQNKEEYLNSLISFIEGSGADGITFDYEGLRNSFEKDYTAFVAEVNKIAKERNWHFGVCVPPRISSGYNRAYNYADLAKHSDEVIIMNYDYDPRKPEHLAPINLTRVVHDHIIDNVSEKDRSKFVFAYGTYGYAFYYNKEKDTYKYASTMQYYNIINRASENGRNTKYIFDEKAQSPCLEYEINGQTIRVFYDDPKSIYIKYQEQIKNGLPAKIGLWELTHTNPFWFKKFEEQFKDDLLVKNDNNKFNNNYPRNMFNNHNSLKQQNALEMVLLKNSSLSYINKTRCI